MNDFEVQFSENKQEVDVDFTDGTRALNGKDGKDGKDGENGVDGSNGKNGKDIISYFHYSTSPPICDSLISR